MVIHLYEFHRKITPVQHVSGNLSSGKLTEKICPFHGIDPPLCSFQVGPSFLIDNTEVTWTS